MTTMDHPNVDDNKDVDDNDSITDDDDDYDDDEFFGAQDDEENENGFGDMGKHEENARHHRLKTASFLDAFDESKEELLQEGFEAGFLESFSSAKLLGQLLGMAATRSKLGSERNHETNANDLVHTFFARDFQANRDPNRTVDDLETLVQATKASFEG